jgi:hypothetical protein
VPEVSAIIVTRMNFAVQHLMAATHFAQKAHQIEIEHAEEPVGPFYSELLWTVSACVFSGVAGIEAYANETFVDQDTTLPGVPSDLVDKVWGLCVRSPVVDKFDVICILRGADVLKRGTRTVQDVEALIALRNGLVHFKPQWDRERAPHASISKRLQGRFQPSPFASGGSLFPDRWASYDCARWAVDASKDYVLAIENTAGLPPKVGQFEQRIHG